MLWKEVYTVINKEGRVIPGQRALMATISCLKNSECEKEKEKTM